MAKKQSSYPLPHRQRPTSVRFKATESGRPPPVPKRTRRGQNIAAYLIAIGVAVGIIWVKFWDQIDINPRMNMVAGKPCDNRVLLRGDYFSANTWINVYYMMLNNQASVAPVPTGLLPEGSILTDRNGSFAMIVEPFSKPEMAYFQGIKFAAQVATDKTMVELPLSLIKEPSSTPSLEAIESPRMVRVDLPPMFDPSSATPISNTGHWSATFYADTDMHVQHFRRACSLGRCPRLT